MAVMASVNGANSLVASAASSLGRSSQLEVDIAPALDAKIRTTAEGHAANPTPPAARSIQSRRASFQTLRVKAGPHYRFGHLAGRGRRVGDIQNVG